MIDISKMTQVDLDIACRVLSESVRKYFSLPGVREEYEAWLAKKVEKEKPAEIDGS